MTIPENIRRSVVFIGYRLADKSYKLAGTGFFLGEHDKPKTVRLVTARHVINAIQSLGLDTVHIRANWQQGGTAWWLESELASWQFPSDSSIDVAMLAGFPPHSDHSVIPTSRLVTTDILHSHDVGLGDEVFIAGLFRHRGGQHRNIPIVRVGNIACFPEEKIRVTDFGDIDAILIEARSLGGLSGSPVFLNLGPVRQIHGRLHLAQDDKPFFLLGLIHGHFDSLTSAIDICDAEELEIADQRVNTGIAIVVPFTQIDESFREIVARA